MFGRRKLKAEVVRLSYRVLELEERLCPCESHSWVVVDSDFTSVPAQATLTRSTGISAAGAERR